MHNSLLKGFLFRRTVYWSSVLTSLLHNLLQFASITHFYQRRAFGVLLLPRPLLFFKVLNAIKLWEIFKGEIHLPAAMFIDT